MAEVPHVDQLRSLWSRCFSVDTLAQVSQATVVALMQRTGLPQSTLAAVWVCAKIHADVPDVTFQEFYLAMRLCALCQTGTELTPACVQTHATMDLPLVWLAPPGGGAESLSSSPPVATLSPMATAPAGPGAAARAVLADCARCSEAERVHYLRALSAIGHPEFSATSAVGPDTMRGLLSRTGLPRATLEKVWRVAQMNPGATAFTFGELTLAMRLAALAQCNREPSLRTALHEQTKSSGWSVPHVRFAGVAASAGGGDDGGGTSTRAGFGRSPGSGPDPGAGASLVPSAAAPSRVSAVAGELELELEWRATYGSALFSELDCAQRGFVGGTPALSFLRRARLPEPVLRRLWALATAHDAASRLGYLSRAGFLVCLRLVSIAQGGALRWLSGSADTSSAAAVFAAVDSTALPAARFDGYEALLAALAPPQRGREKFARGEHAVYIDSRGGATTELPAEILKVHLDPPNEAYYTIRYGFETPPREKQTIRKKLRTIALGAAFGEEAAHYDRLIARCFAQPGHPAAQACAEAGGGVTGVALLPLLQRSGLPDPVLRQLWMAIDAGGLGFLFRTDLHALFRLIALVTARGGHAVGDASRLNRASALNEATGVAFAMKQIQWYAL